MAGIQGDRCPVRTGRTNMTTAHPSPDDAGTDPTRAEHVGPTPAGTDPVGTTQDPDRYVVSRTVAAVPPEVVALLRDPARTIGTVTSYWETGTQDSVSA